MEPNTFVLLQRETVVLTKILQCLYERFCVVFVFFVDRTSKTCGCFSLFRSSEYHYCICTS